MYCNNANKGVWFLVNCLKHAQNTSVIKSYNTDMFKNRCYYWGNVWPVQKKDYFCQKYNKCVTKSQERVMCLPFLCFCKMKPYLFVWLHYHRILKVFILVIFSQTNTWWCESLFKKSLQLCIFLMAKEILYYITYGSEKEKEMAERKKTHNS